MNEFKEKLEFCFQQSIPNNFVNNVGHAPIFTNVDKKNILKNREIARNAMGKIQADDFEKVYNLLNDDYSRDLFIKLISYKYFIGPSKVQLPLSDKNFWADMFDVEILCKKEQKFKHCGKIFNLFDLRPIGYNYQMFINEERFAKNQLKQYEYNKNRLNFKVKEGDYVIDGGAYIGDTAFNFAESVGAEGKVFCFEFVEDNLEVLHENILLNPHLKNRIKIVENALWSNSNEYLYVLEDGAASYVTISEETNPNYSYKVPSKSIDDLIKEQDIPKIDFIKLDIEGSELECIKGAKDTINKFRPRLAVCLYHKPEDFTEIPQYINEMYPYYDFYIDTHSMSYLETVIYANPK